MKNLVLSLEMFFKDFFTYRDYSFFGIPGAFI
jgi:hypothetical protein